MGRGHIRACIDELRGVAQDEGRDCRHKAERKGGRRREDMHVRGGWRSLCKRADTQATQCVVDGQPCS